MGNRIFGDRRRGLMINAGLSCASGLSFFSDFVFVEVALGLRQIDSNRHRVTATVTILLAKRDFIPENPQLYCGYVVK